MLSRHARARQRGPERMPARHSGPFYVGVDLGGTKVLALVTTGDGQVLASTLSSTPDGLHNVIHAMANATREAIDRAGVEATAIAGVGIAAAGAVDRERGSIIHSPHIPSMVNSPVGELLSRELDLPTIIGNDAQLAALGEQRYGAGRGHDNVLFITISTGIGGGIIIGNQVYQGMHGQAGEVGHITVNAHGPHAHSVTPGAWEAHCSGTALVRIARERIQAGEPSSMKPRGLTAPDIFTAMRASDVLACSLVSDAIEYLGAGLTSLVNILDPEKIIIGGGLSNEWEAYIAPGIELMRQQGFAGVGRRIDVVPPELGAMAGAMGGAVLAQDATRAP